MFQRHGAGGRKISKAQRAAKLGDHPRSLCGGGEETGLQGSGMHSGRRIQKAAGLELSHFKNMYKLSLLIIKLSPEVSRSYLVTEGGQYGSEAGFSDG